MYKITWDKETGGVLLHSRIVEGTLGISPRPVFFEELDLLGLDKLGWTYPHVEEPIMWAVNKQYWYRGVRLFDAKGANIYTKPTLEIQPGIEPMELVPVDVKKMLQRTSDLMFVLENEAIEFIRDTYLAYAKANKTYNKADANKLDFESMAERVEKKSKQHMAVVKQDCDSFDIMPLATAEKEGKRVLLSTKIDRFIASFSGGKDSQVVLDLCTRAIPPTDFEVIYSDTGYELPPSLALYKDVEAYYKKKFPSLRFLTASNHESVLSYWDKIGTPSDNHRWCCSVMKTAPLYRMLKVEGNKQARVLTFDGVRAEESVRRSGYNRIGKGVKHSTVINASPILSWSSVEVFLYLFRYGFPINIAYRRGITRVGCIICPFSSEWNDMVVNQTFHEKLEPFLSRIEDNVKRNKVQDFRNYIEDGNWKRRAGGRDIHSSSAIDFLSSKPDLNVMLIKPQKHPLTWISAIAPFTGSEKQGELKYRNEVYSYKCENNGDVYSLSFKNTAKSLALQGLIKRALNKATFCINCEACEVECPTGALSILPKAEIDTNKCIHCGKCLNFHETGCIVAHSLKITETPKSKMKLISYNNFGLREEWLDYYMSNHDDYFQTTNHGLNVKEQLPSFVKWLVQAEILSDTKKREITPFGKLLIEIYENNPSLVWQIIWINLTYNSPIAHWYSQNVSFGSNFTDADLREGVKNDYSSDSTTTIKNVVYALTRTFKESPIGEELGQMTKVDKNTYTRSGFSDIEVEAVAYSLYKYAQIKESNLMRVSDFYKADEKDGIYKEFGISKSDLEKKLRFLSSDSHRVLVAELNMGLDHITLRDDLTPEKALETLAK